ncbi:MAG: PAS domain-containing protein, partial [Candidatus Binatia bacterium]
MTQTKATGHKELSPIEEIVLADGGTMAALMRTFDWETSPLGPVSEWPHSLHTVVSIALTSQFPIVIFWGPELRMFYNDAYLPMLADKHPASLGQAAQEVWPEIWSIIGPMLYEVLETGQATWSYDLLLPLVHHGAAQEHYFTFSYSPIRDESGNVCGVFCPVTETTARLQGERRERHLRAEAEAARDRVTHILESMREGHFVLDHEWRITSVNAAAARFTQRRQEELPGKNFWKEFPAVWSLVAGSEFRRAMTERVAVEVEDHYPPFDEWYEVRAYPLPDGGLSIFLRDITQRKRNEEVLRQTQDALERRVQERTAELVQVNETLRKEINERIQTEQQLQHSHERIRTILESITSGFYALDHQWRFTYVNAQAGPLIQRIPEELLGKSVWEEFPEAAESIVYQEYQRAVTEQVAVKFNIFYQSLQVCFEIHAYPSPDGLSVYFHDISERKRIEEKLHQSERLAVIGTTVAKLGHEIGNPLNGMFSTIQILERVLARQPSPDAMVVESVQDLKHEINRLRALLHELRTFV